MPIIPQYTTREQITGEAPSVRVEPDLYARPGRVAQETGALLGRVSDLIGSIRDTNQVNEANIFSTRELSLLEESASKAEDIWNAEKSINERIGEIRDEAASGIANSIERQKFLNSFDLKSISVMKGVRSTLASRQIDASKANLNESIEADSDLYYKKTTAEERAIIKTSIKDRITDHANRNILTREQATKLWQATEKELINGEVKGDLYLDPNRTLIELRKESHGKYPDLDPSSRKQFLEEAEKMSEKLLKEGEESLLIAQTTAEAEALESAFNKQITLDEVDKLEMKNQISSKFATRLRDYMLKPEVTTSTKDLTFIELIDEFSDLEALEEKATLKQISEYRLKVMDAHNNGLLDNGDFKTLMRNSQEAFTKRFQTEAVAEVLREKRAPKNFLQAISFWSDEYTYPELHTEVRAKMYKNFMNKLQQKMPYEDALRETIQEQIKEDVGSAMAVLNKPSETIQAQIFRDIAAGISVEQIKLELEAAGVNTKLYRYK